MLSPALSRTADACGGFWCSQTNPVDQSAENIIFIDNPDETVTTVIQIQYVGPAEKFAWLIPIPGEPEIEVSSNTVFQRLIGTTTPSYTVEQHVEGTCMAGFQFGPGCPTCGGVLAPTAASPQEDAASPSIMVLDSGTVGDYTYVTISVNPQLDDPAQSAIDWLVEEGYDLTAVDSMVLGPYLADGLNLLAFKLTKGANATSGAIRPVALTYQAAKPMIPLRPTAVAAQDDMGIRVWVVSEEQAVPDNYLSLVINDALIDWLNPSYNYNFGPIGPGFGGGSAGLPSNYDAVVTRAANEAGGQGFVTELAGASEEHANALFSPMEEQQLADLEAMQYADGIDAIWMANNYYRSWDGWRESIVAAVTLPQGVDINSFASNPDAYRGQATVDLDVFFGELRNRVVAPLQRAQELLSSRPYLTRLYSTMSAEEMNKDPVFTYNPDLADVEKDHVAQMYIECSPQVTQDQAPWRIETPQGGVIRGQGYAWPIALDAVPANLKVVQLSESGAGTIMMDNSGAIGSTLFEQSGMVGTGAAIPDPPDDGMVIGGDDHVVTLDEPGVGPGSPDPDAQGEASGGGLCSVAFAGAPSSGAWLPFAGVLFAWLARRKRRG